MELSSVLTSLSTVHNDLFPLLRYTSYTVTSFTIEKKFNY